MTPIRLGEVEITRVVEIPRSFYPTADMLPASSKDALGRHAAWLAPFVDAETGDLGSRIQTYVVRTPDETVLIDTCVGNDKTRHEAPIWNMRQGSWLEDLRAAGVAPGDVDFVLCTHMHVDHVGWNTRLVDGRWTPTFPRATYVFVGEEWDFWKHERDAGTEPSGCIDDSVVPIVEAGRARLVEATAAIGRFLRFEPTPGHTPGHACVRLTTAQGQAVFTGDLMHRIVQVAEPAWSSRFCHDATQAARTRRDFLERHADTGTLVCAAHFPTPGYVVRKEGGLRFEGRP